MEGAPDYGNSSVCWRMTRGLKPGFSLFSLADRLRVRGWQVPAYLLPAHCEEATGGKRDSLWRHGVSRDLATMLLDDNPPSTGIFRTPTLNKGLSSGDEAGGFHH